jgi:Tol biopolymer transport system component
MFCRFSPLREGARKLKKRILRKREDIMKTIHVVIGNRWRLKQTQRLLVLLLAATLVGSVAGPSLVAARSRGTRSAVVLQTTTVPALTGTFQLIYNGPAQQRPHVDCNLVSYTGWDSIHYFDFATNSDHAVPAGPRSEILPDVAGSQIAFTMLFGMGDDRSVFIYDTVSQTDTFRGNIGTSNPSIGGTLMAFEDILNGQIGIYDQSTGAVTHLTNDALLNRNPRVSKTGNAVVWEKCQPDGTGSAIYSAVQTSPGTFQTTLLSGAGENRGPATNGTLVAYVSDKSGENDIYYQPVGGGAETHLSIPGDQRHVSISGDLIAFESTVSTGGYDVFVYDLRTGKLYQVTNTPLLDETLSDISVCDGIGRIVYAVVTGWSSADVYAFTFQVPGSTVDQIGDLIALVNSFSLTKGAGASLIAKLQDALAAINASDTAMACDSLTAFVNETQAQSGKKLSTDQASQLINSANQIKTGLGCQ